VTGEQKSTQMTMGEILCNSPYSGTAGIKGDSDLAKRVFCEVLSAVAPTGTKTLVEEGCNTLLNGGERK